MSKLSIAYNEGFNSKKYNNPYKASTREYNDFERGWSQRVKHGLPIIDIGKNHVHEIKELNIIKLESPPKREETKKRKLEEIMHKYGYSLDK